jgi:hypothetical protein
MANPYAPPGMDDGGFVPPGGPPTSGGPLPWELGEVYTAGWETLKRQPILAVGLFILYLVPNLASAGSGILDATGILESGSMLSLMIGLSASLIALIINQFLQVGLVRMFVAAAKGQEASLGLLFSGADRFLPMVGYSIVSGFAVVFGLVLLIVPGVILAIGLSLGQYYLIDQRQGVFESMKLSWEVTRGNRMDLFIFFLVGGALALLGLCACFVGTFVTTSIVMAAMAVIYLRRSGQAASQWPAYGGAGGVPPGASPPGYPPAHPGGYYPQGMG